MSATNYFKFYDQKLRALCNFRYNEIAERAFAVVQVRAGGAAPAGPWQQSAGTTSLQSVSQELYRAVLFSVFFLQIVAVGYVPYAGKTLDPRP